MYLFLRLWGTLTVTLVVHPEIVKDQNCAIAVERSIDALKYGTVCMNAYPGMSFAAQSTVNLWGLVFFVAFSIYRSYRMVVG